MLAQNMHALLSSSEILRKRRVSKNPQFGVRRSKTLALLGMHALGGEVFGETWQMGNGSALMFGERVLCSSIIGRIVGILFFFFN